MGCVVDVVDMRKLTTMRSPVLLGIATVIIAIAVGLADSGPALEGPAGSARC